MKKYYLLLLLTCLAAALASGVYLLRITTTGTNQAPKLVREGARANSPRVEINARCGYCNELIKNC